jgi:hypothetical protein
MSSLNSSEVENIYLSIVQGKISEKVGEGAPGAVRREWEAGGKKGVKWEKIYEDMQGFIEEVSFYEGEHDGRKFVQLQLKFDKQANGMHPVLAMGTTTKYAEDVMKKLPLIDFGMEVKIRPFNFIDPVKDKPVTGVSIYQQDGMGKFEKKIGNFFYDTEGKKAKNGMVEPTDEEKDNSDWEMYYKKVNRFLTKYTRENIVPKFPLNEAKKVAPAYPKQEIDAEEIPF